MYEQRISTKNPGLIHFVLDDSGSHDDPLPGTSDAKYKYVERYFGVMLEDLLARCTEPSDDGVIIKHRYFLHVITYGSDTCVWNGGLLDIESAVEKYAAAGNSLGLGGKLGGTNAERAFLKCLSCLNLHLRDERFVNSYPAMVFHLTDGESQTAASRVAEQISQLSTLDGNVLLVNAYIGTRTGLSYKGPEDFPGYQVVSEAGASEYNVPLFNMSSEIPASMHANLVNSSIFPNLREGSRLFFDVRTREMLKSVIQVVGSIGSQAER